MIPRIFVSSTIEDLHHLRDAIRETIEELEYIPIMSEYGDIGYLPDATAEQSAYKTIRECQLAILIIGKRYGSIGANKLSVTHNEFRLLREFKIPIIPVVDAKILNYKEIYDANKTLKERESYPGMDNADRSFSLIQEINDAPENNGILPFDKVQEARLHLKRQIAHLFGELLIRRFDPIDNKLNTVLSELKTLRHELLKGTAEEAKLYLRAMQFLLSGDGKEYSNLIETLGFDIDAEIPKLVENSTFKNFMEALGVSIEIDNDNDYMKMDRKIFISSTLRSIRADEYSGKFEIAMWAVLRTKGIMMNELAAEHFKRLHAELILNTVKLQS